MASPKPSPRNNPSDSPRINRHLAACGFGSRRACEKLVLEGRVRVDGETLDDLSFRVEPRHLVEVDGRPVQVQASRYYLLNKPRGVVCSSSDPQGRPTCLSLLPETGERVYNVGRLDMDSEGLLVITNDGALAHRLTHPRHHVDKVYELELDQELSADELKRCVQGLRHDGERLTARAIVPIGARRYRVTLGEGRNRHIRRMMETLDRKVKRLRRVQLGFLELGSLPSGAWRELGREEVERCHRMGEADEEPEA